MSNKSEISELAVAQARADADQLTCLIDAYEAHLIENDFSGPWPRDWADAFGDIQDWPTTDSDKALAFIVLGAARSNHPGFVALLACGPLEDILREPSSAMIERIVSEAHHSSRFRWLLNHPYKVAVSNNAWRAIQPVRTASPHEEPPPNTMPDSYFS